MDIVKAYCNRCGGERRHELLYSETTTWEDEIDDHFSVDGGDKFDLIKCCGCELVALRRSSWFSEETEPDGTPIIKVEQFPPETYRAEPKWITDLIWSMPIDDNFVGEFIKEIYIALRNKSLRLAVMGIRALLEQVMIDKVGDKGTFKKNLDAFQNAGHISKSQRDALDPVIEAGHAAMHRRFKPTARDVGTLMDVTESIVESIYINDHRSRQISKIVPSRKS